ncbi:MAG: RDD family protein, partial [Pseudomonadota bacterium]
TVGHEAKRTEILPPEGVPIHFEVASLGARFGAQITDIALTGGIVIIFMITLASSEWLSGDSVIAVGALAFFCLRAPYYIATEILWNGQTLGKRLLGLRVISGDGRALSPHAITVRNLMKEIEVFVPGTYLLAAADLGFIAGSIILLWIVVLLTVPLLNKRRQRLGDIIANTFVIGIPRPVLMPDLTRAPIDPGAFTFLPHHLDHYGRYELQTLEQILQVKTETLNAAAQHQHNTNLKRVADAIIARIGFEANVPQADTAAFLRAFYRTQRAYLENRKLFGDAREDKFHRDPERAS